ncbi:unnamed protein product [Rhizophagus irregularis]|nr:unnamed protein product [Rhizophagus irregularis]CAB4428089.1 unnamed protein product [Rhizophagus irregularis]
MYINLKTTISDNFYSVVTLLSYKNNLVSLNIPNTESNNQTISDASQTETSKKMKIAKLDLFHDKDIDMIIAINESSTISSYIFLVVISPSFSIKTTISDKATSDNKAVSGKAASDKVVSSSSKSSSSSVKTVISKESLLDNNVTITTSKVTKTKVTDQS